MIYVYSTTYSDAVHVEHITFLPMFSAAVPSGPPLLLSSNMVTSTSFKVRWQQPQPQDRNGIITYYRLRLENRRTSTLSYLNVQRNSVPYTVRNLSPFTTYTWAVAAATVNGTGPYSSNHSVQTLPACKSAKGY